MMCWAIEIDNASSTFTACLSPAACRRCENCVDHCDCADEITREFYCDGGGDA
jgi:hypothetical protein